MSSAIFIFSVYNAYTLLRLPKAACYHSVVAGRAINFTEAYFSVVSGNAILQLHLSWRETFVYYMTDGEAECHLQHCRRTLLPLFIRRKNSYSSDVAWRAKFGQLTCG